MSLKDRDKEKILKAIGVKQLATFRGVGKVCLRSNLLSKPEEEARGSWHTQMLKNTTKQNWTTCKPKIPQVTKNILQKWKLKTFSDQPQIRRKYSQIIYLIKDLCPKYLNYIRKSRSQQLEDLLQICKWENNLSIYFTKEDVVVANKPMKWCSKLLVMN